MLGAVPGTEKEIEMFETTIRAYGVDYNFAAESVEELHRDVFATMTGEGYGTSDVGSQFAVTRGGEKIGVMSWNGKFVENAA